MKAFSALFRLVSMVGLSLIVSACAAHSGRMENTTGTLVGLNQNNYKVIKPGASGESMGFKFCFIPIVPTSFAQAKRALYANVGENLAGRSVALANQTEDISGLNLIVFQIPRLTLTADVVEFNADGSKTPSGSSSNAKAKKGQ